MGIDFSKGLTGTNDRTISGEEYIRETEKAPTPPEQPSLAYKVGELLVKIASNHEMAEEIQDILFGGYVTVGGGGNSVNIYNNTVTSTTLITGSSIDDRLDKMLVRSEECSRVLLAVINRLGK
jgi:hypothetical protein